MNEQRKSFNDYTNPKQSKRQQSVDELIIMGNELLKKYRSQLSLSAIIYIKNALDKQLNKRNVKIPGKVLRGIEQTFQKYENQVKR